MLLFCKSDLHNKVLSLNLCWCPSQSKKKKIVFCLFGHRFHFCPSVAAGGLNLVRTNNDFCLLAFGSFINYLVTGSPYRKPKNKLKNTTNKIMHQKNRSAIQ